MVLLLLSTNLWISTSHDISEFGTWFHGVSSPFYVLVLTNLWISSSRDISESDTWFHGNISHLELGLPLFHANWSVHPPTCPYQPLPCEQNHFEGRQNCKAEGLTCVQSQNLKVEGFSSCLVKFTLTRLSWLTAGHSNPVFIYLWVTWMVIVWTVFSQPWSTQSSLSECFACQQVETQFALALRQGTKKDAASSLVLLVLSCWGFDLHAGVFIFMLRC